MTCLVNHPVTRALFNAQGTATMGLDPEWDRAVTNYIAADVRAKVQEEYGPLARKENDDGLEAIRLAHRLGKGWRETAEGKAAWTRHAANRKAQERDLTDTYYQPLWAAMRELACTPAPSLAAALWKAAVIDLQEVWNDGEFEGDCVALIDADLARFTGADQ